MVAGGQPTSKRGNPKGTTTVQNTKQINNYIDPNQLLYRSKLWGPSESDTYLMLYLVLYLVLHLVLYLVLYLVLLYILYILCPSGVETIILTTAVY